MRDAVPTLLEIAEAPKLFGDLFELGFREFTLLLVLDDDTAKQEPSEVTRALEAGAFDRVLDAVGEIFRDRNRRILCHTPYSVAGAKGVSTAWAPRQSS